MSDGRTTTSKARIHPLAFAVSGTTMLLILLSLVCPIARAGNAGFLPPPTPRHLFRVARAGAGGSLVQFDDEVLDRLLHRARAGEIFTIPLPTLDAELAFDHESIDPKLDLDCCSVTLRSADGETTIPLTRTLSPRDFELRYRGKIYRFRSAGNGNFEMR